MSVLTLNVDEVMRTLSAESSNPFVVHDKEVDIVRFALNTGFTDVVLDEYSALRVMYQRPGETEVRAKTLTYYDTDGLRNYYDWQLLSADLAEKGTLTVALCILRTDGDVEEWHTTPCQVRVLDTIHTDDSDEGDETITPTVAQRVAVLETMIQRVASGAPAVVGSVSEMTDTNQIYVLSTDGNWYYHNGSAWVAGGEYGGVAAGSITTDKLADGAVAAGKIASGVVPTVDSTLTQAGAAADAGVVGTKVSEIKGNITQSANAVIGNRNLIDIPTGSYTASGITYTADGDTVTATGTASANSIYNRIKFQVPVSGNYTLSGCPQGGSLSKYYVRLNGVNGIDYGNGATVTLEAFVEYTLWIVVAKNAVVSDTVFSLKLVWADETIHSCVDAINSVRQNADRVLSAFSVIPGLRDGSVPNGGIANNVAMSFVVPVNFDSKRAIININANITGATNYTFNLYTFDESANGMSSYTAITSATVIRRISGYYSGANNYCVVDFSGSEKYFAIDIGASDGSTAIPCRVGTLGNCLTILFEIGTDYAYDLAQDVKSDLLGLGTVTEYELDIWEHGYISPATGNETYVSNRLRTKRYLPKNIYALTVSNSYKYLILGYNNDDTYLGCWDGRNFNYSTSWTTATPRNLSGLTDYNLRLVIADANDSSLTVQDADNIIFDFYGYKTDKTLTIPDVPADAKATGDIIRNIVSSKNIYSSVADMKSDTTLMLGAYCVTTGYYTANDGGGASYLVRSKAVSDVENGGTIHFLNNGYVAELITDTPNTLNLKQWGAKSDGETDISDAYSRCIEYIKENYPVTFYNGDNGVGGGTIFFPAGRYKTTTQLEARHYVEICGENEYTTIITSSASNAFYSSRDDYPDAPDGTGRQNNFRVKNITFYNCNVAIQMRQSIGTIIENCQFIGCQRGILVYLTVKVTIRNCLFRACTNGVFLGTMGVGPSTAVFIDKCWFRHCSGAALKVVGTDNKCGYQPCSLIDTIFEYNNQTVDIEGSETYPSLINFARCFFEGNTNPGTIINASVVADIQNFFAPIGRGINVTPAEYNKVNISNLSDTYGFHLT